MPSETFSNQDFGLQEPSPVGVLFANERRRVRAAT